MAAHQLPCAVPHPVHGWTCVIAGVLLCWGAQHCLPCCWPLLCVQISTIYPLAIIHVLGNVLTNVSLGKVAVSFTHTVKVSTGRVDRVQGRGVCRHR
jgi:hypothetical protein